MALLNLSGWEGFLSHHPRAHLLQSGAWGQLKADFGWQVERIAAGSSGVQVLFRRLPLGYTFAYIPKGPVGPDWDSLWPEVDALCRGRRSVFLKVEPDCWEDPDRSATALPPAGFRLSAHAVQPPRTLVVDLAGSEEEILSRMKQKTRYNIRLAMKKGVVVRPSADLELFHRMMEVTGQRDGFSVHSLAYYQRTYELFHPYGECELLVAEFEARPLAALMVFCRGDRAWYLYGASENTHREYMATYLLQWEAMRWARAQGCTQYDLWGVPDASEQALEAGFTSRSDGLWGVYRFKRGFGGDLRRSCGPWDRVYNPALYLFYRWWTRRNS